MNRHHAVVNHKCKLGAENVSQMVVIAVLGFTADYCLRVNSTSTYLLCANLYSLLDLPAEMIRKHHYSLKFAIIYGILLKFP